MRRIYKKTLKAFGGTALYLDKVILRELGIECGDEVIIEVGNGKAVITKPLLDTKQIEELLDANAKLKKRV